MTGKVYFVGSGLGDPAELTHRATQILQQADVVLVDDLVDRRVLVQLPGRTRVVGVGKRAGQATTTQEDINRLLVQFWQEGKQVVRLKSGDPLIFGRTLEEIVALQAVKAEFELVPGLSSALAAPLMAGIPLTDKTLSRSITLVTGHQVETLPWPALSTVDTVVVLMGSQRLVEIAERLLENGRDLATPAALIASAGRPEQQVWIGSLATLGAQQQRWGSVPAVLVIGAVVGLRDKVLIEGRIPVTESRLQPLAGKTVLVTRADTQSQTLTQLLQDQGARVIELPTLVIQPPSSWDPLDQAIAHLGEYDWLILTSANAVTGFFERLWGKSLDSRALQGIRVAVVGTKTAATLAQYGIRPDLIPDEFVADALLEAFPEPELRPTQAFLFPRVESGGREVLVQGLRDQGARVTEVAAYQSGCPTHADPVALSALQQQQVDVVTFASSKTVLHFCRILNQSGLDREAVETLLRGVTLAAIGPKTADTCIAELGRVEICAQPYTLEGLVDSLVAFFGP